MAVIIQIRRGTAAAWTATNPILADAEIGYEKGTGKLKFGDGVTAWNSLAYLATGGGAGTPEEIRDALQSLVGTDRLDASAIKNLFIGVTGTAVDNTDPKNPVINLPTAPQVAYSPSGGISATNVGAAIAELDGEKQAISEKNQPGGYPGLGGDGKINAAQLPSYVDDVLEFANLAAFPVSGETGKIYIAIDTNRSYRWSGSIYVEIVANPGTTDNVPEGATNQYFTAARVRAVVLTGLSLVTGGVISATDSILVALGKLQKQITDAIASIPATTDNLTEGSTRLYFTEARVRATVLTGLAAGANTAIVAGNSVLTAFANLQAQITATLNSIPVEASQVDTDAGTLGTSWISPRRLFGKLKAKTTTATAFTVDSANDLKMIIASPVAPINATVNSAALDVVVPVANFGTANINFVAGSGVTLSGINTLVPNRGAYIRYTSATTAVVIGGGTISWGNILLRPNTVVGFGIIDAIRSFFTSFTTASSVGAAETVLYTTNVAGGTLGTDGVPMGFVAAVRTVANANNKTIRVKFGGLTIFDTGAMAITTASDFCFRGEIIRVSAGSFKSVVTVVSNNSTVPSVCKITQTTALDLTADQAMAVTGQGTSNGDVVFELITSTKAGA